MFLFHKAVPKSFFEMSSNTFDDFFYDVNGIKTESIQHWHGAKSVE